MRSAAGVTYLATMDTLSLGGRRRAYFCGQPGFYHHGAGPSPTLRALWNSRHDPDYDRPRHRPRARFWLRRDARQPRGTERDCRSEWHAPGWAYPHGQRSPAAGTAPRAAPAPLVASPAPLPATLSVPPPPGHRACPVGRRWVGLGTPSPVGVAYAGRSAAAHAPPGTPGVWTDDSLPQP